MPTLPSASLPSLPTSGLTQELDPEVAGFSEQRPANDNLLGRVESVPHDQRDTWAGVKRGWGTGQPDPPTHLRQFLVPLALHGKGSPILYIHICAHTFPQKTHHTMGHRVSHISSLGLSLFICEMGDLSSRYPAPTRFCYDSGLIGYLVLQSRFLFKWTENLSP